MSERSVCKWAYALNMHYHSGSSCSNSKKEETSGYFKLLVNRRSDKYLQVVALFGLICVF